MEQKETFAYTYSAPQQEEIKQIRAKYLPQEPDKMEQLRRLDQAVSRRAMSWGLAVGILSCLILGTGMSCCLEGAPTLFIPGIVIGILGLIGMALAYPVYQHTLKIQRQKLAPEILRLSEELLK